MADLRNSAEKPLNTLNEGLLFHYFFSKSFSLTLGLAYHHFGQKANYQYENPDRKDSIFSLSDQFTNDFYFFQIPCLIGYKKSLKFFDLGIAGGINLNILENVKAALPNTTRTAFVRVKNKDINTFNLAWSLEGRFIFPLNNSIFFDLDPYLTYQFSSLYSGLGLLTEFPYFYGLRAGISCLF